MSSILLPYIITILPIALLYTFQNTDNWILQSYSVGFRFSAVMLGSYIINGSMWFMGMIIPIFAISPLLLKIQRNKTLYTTIILLAFVSMLITARTSPTAHYAGRDFSHNGFLKLFLLNTAYYSKMAMHFLFFYLLGMLVSQIFDRYLDYIKQNLKLIFKIALFLYVFHFIVHFFIIKTFFNIQMVSKLIEIFLILSGLMLIESKIQSHKILDKTLKTIARYSFGIFFIHQYIINYFYFHSLYWQRNTPSFFDITSNNFAAFGKSMLLFTVTFCGSLAILFILKFALKKLGIKNTRMFIGV